MVRWGNAGRRGKIDERQQTVIKEAREAERAKTAERKRERG